MRKKLNSIKTGATTKSVLTKFENQPKHLKPCINMSFHRTSLSSLFLCAINLHSNDGNKKEMVYRDSIFDPQSRSCSTATKYD